MKSFKYLIGIALISLGLASCDNALDKEPLDSFTNTNFWSSVSNVEAYANTFYNQFSGYGNAGAYGWTYFKTLSDDQVGSGFVDWDHKSATTTNSTWNNGYTEIKRANVLIQKVSEMGEDKITEKERNNWLGVAHLMRAYEYYLLVRTFGDVIWVDKPLETTDKDILYGKRTDRDVIMDYVLEDLDFAIANIATQSAICAWSKDLALAMKSDICLYEGTFCKYRVKNEGSVKDADPDRAKKYLEECVKANDALISSGTYELTPGIEGYQATYNSLDLTTKTKQIIFAKHYVKDVFMHSTVDYTTGTTTIHGISKDGFKAFRLTADNSEYTWSNNDDITETKAKYGEYENKAGEFVYADKLGIEKILEKIDKRASVLVDPYLAYRGNGHVRGDLDMDGIDDKDTEKKNNHEMVSSTGLTIKKYHTNAMPYDYIVQINKNYTDAPLYWYAVILLNQAEAKAELKTITDDDLDATVNLLRARAGLKALSNADYTGYESLIAAIRNDRRCELMVDNWYRYWDLVRWHKLDNLTKEDVYLGAKVDKNDLAKVEGGLTLTEDGFINPYPDRRKWDPKYYLYPIPENERTLNPNLGQNPGW